jgi:hypothetical protein
LFFLPRYTLVVHAGTNTSAPFTLLEDVKGDATWVPVVVAIFVVLAVVVVVNLVERWLAARSAAQAAAAGEEPPAVATSTVRVHGAQQAWHSFIVLPCFS